jgi:hypothetical protein
VKRLFKIIGINLLILTAGLVLIELIFGGWFSEGNNLKNLSIIRDRKYIYQTDLYTQKPLTIQYSRDVYGFRGERCFNKPEGIDILTIGGSTTDQRYINDGETWQDVLENQFSKDGRDVVVGNAGVDGQSTIGHIKNFEIWFPMVPKLKPKYVLFYIGINDFYRIKDDSRFDAITDSAAARLGGSNELMEKLKDKSVLYSLLRKTRGWFRAQSNRIGHTKTDFSKLNYTYEGVASKSLFELYEKNIAGFENRLSVLMILAQKMGAIPIFVMQPSMMFRFDKSGKIMGVSDVQFIESYRYNGVDFYHLLNKLNASIRKKCSGSILVDLTHVRDWEETDFYDLFHNTPQGAKKVGLEIYKNIKNKRF